MVFLRAVRSAAASRRCGHIAIARLGSTVAKKAAYAIRDVAAALILAVLREN
jgi:hypothetical protein